MIRLSARSPKLDQDQLARKAILLTFLQGTTTDLEALTKLDDRGWLRLLQWLDISGLALYFLEELERRRLCGLLPSNVLSHLSTNARNNLARTRGMIEESIAVQRAFQQSSLIYSVMKGLSLCPISLPRPHLRHQFDLDFLVAENSAEEARRLLEARGYRLFAVSGATWEFKINETPYVSARDLYKDNDYRSVELHIEPEIPGEVSRLSRLVLRDSFGLTMPVLDPIDLFVGQAMHAFKDVLSAFSRTSHLLEFYWHICNRAADTAFWEGLRSRSGGNRRVCTGIGTVTYLLSTIMGPFAPKELTVWTVDVLPPAISLWVDRYGHRTVFGEHPGTKLYLLLQKSLEAEGLPKGRPVGRSLLPSRLPSSVVRPSPGEALRTKILRYGIQARYVLSRLRFHMVEGARYVAEVYRWRRLLEETNW
jgi:hypothetical protein